MIYDQVKSNDHIVSIRKRSEVDEMYNTINNKDKHILRELAKKQFEFSQLPQMERLKKDWINHNECRRGRPIITVELWSFGKDIVPPLLKCENAEARSIEMEFYYNFVNHDLFKDDTVVRDYFPVVANRWFKPFDIDISVDYANSDSNNLGHHFKELIKDMKEDFHLLKKSSFGAEMKEETMKNIDALNEIFGDILPARLTGRALSAVPTPQPDGKIPDISP